jgi:hypothetical protein
MKTTILALTFDYEMFSGNPGDTYNNIIEPTNKLLEIFKSNNIKATFFIETVFIKKLIEYSKQFSNLKNEFLLIKEQLKKMVQLGHRIELHLHPYWLDGVYNGKKWNITSFKYNRLQNMPENTALELFSDGVTLLESIAYEVQPNYKVKAFRAGGWCVQPFEIIKKCFIKNKIEIDSSVAPQIKMNSLLYIADFTDIPETTDSYYFENNPTLLTKSGFLEIPITTFKRTFYNKIKNKFLTLFDKKNHKKFGNGSGVPMKKTDIKKNINMVSLEGKLHKNIFLEEIQSLAKQKNILTIISHPKNITLNSFKLIKALCAQKNFEFKTLTEIYERVEQND